MAMRAGPRMPVGSAAWISEERSAASQIAQSEIEEFSFSARNEVDWLNEHMAEIFSENQMNVAELFKTPGKLRSKTPRTAKKTTQPEARVPLSDVFSTTPKGAPNAFAKTLMQAQHSRPPQFRVAEDEPRVPESRQASPLKAAVASPIAPVPSPARIPVTDSGYYGSQEPMDLEEPAKRVEFEATTTLAMDVDAIDFATAPVSLPVTEEASPTVGSGEDTFQSAKEEQTRQATVEPTANVPSPTLTATDMASNPAITRTAHESSELRPFSPKKQSPVKSLPFKISPVKSAANDVLPSQSPTREEDSDDDMRSPSEGSSPIKAPIRKKSSLNFASLPAREPLTSNKSLGARMSRTSYLDQTRTSYYNRNTGGKSLGTNFAPDVTDADQDDQDEMDVDEGTAHDADVESRVAAHNKTYTQRLQDQISMLGKSSAADQRPSKSLANLFPSQQSLQLSQAQVSQTHEESQQQGQGRNGPPSPVAKKSLAAPGAFPEDDEDDWIAPPSKAVFTSSPRPPITKSRSADETGPSTERQAESSSEFLVSKSRPTSPKRPAMVPERTKSAPGHTKSASVPAFPTVDPSLADGDATSLKKVVSVSNPPLSTVAEDSSQSTPPKSPSRSIRDSPLKSAKNKVTSLVKIGKALFGSSAALSADAKASLLSPSTTRLGLHPGASVESFRTAENVLYPDLSQATGAQPRPGSPARSNSTRRTRASAEREKREAKEKDKEEKEAKRQAEQLEKLERMREKEEEKLEKIREKEREKARVFSQEQEKIAEMEKRLALQKEFEKATHAQAKVEAQAETQKTPAPPTKSPQRATRTSPRKAKAQLETDAEAAVPSQVPKAPRNDVEVNETIAPMPPPSVPRSATASVPRPQPAKRTIKPPTGKVKQAPTVIRVNPLSSQHYSSSSISSNSLADNVASQPPTHQRSLVSKPSHVSLQSKPSINNFKSSASSTGKPRALELAQKRREEEERDAQRKREAKLELQRKREKQEEERRQERQRQAELERQREEEKRQAAQAAAQAKKDAQRQAAIERAKQTRAPPPAARSQPNGPPDYSLSEKGPSRPPSRLGQDSSRPVNAVLSSSSKMGSKRPLQQDGNEDKSRPPPSRSGTSYQSKDASKRIRLSDDSDDDIQMADSQPTMKGPAVRPSLKRDLPSKSVFASGYAGVPQQGATRDLFKTMPTQHASQAKPTNPMDMAQFSKGTIPFATNPNVAGPAHKTPARTAGGLLAKSAAKSATRSSPRFQNGEAIELPEIQTDDEDDEDDAAIGVADWANSPALASMLARQELMDPNTIFGPPAPLNMEEVFNKNKDRWHKFRARTSSANWSGSDRLTEEEIRKDLQARDKMRREGGWSYDISKEIA